MKKFLATILAVLLVVSMIPMTALATEAQKPAGEQYENDGWIAISTPAEFLAMSETGNYYLTNDIDFSTLPSDHVNYGNIVDGVYTAAYLVQTFNGNLDGRGYTLKGFALVTSANGGVFSSAATTAITTVSNLNIGEQGTPIVATITNAGNVQFGFLASAVGENTVTYKFIANNVTVYGECTAAEQASTNQVRCGGMVGYSKEADFYDCTFIGSISVNLTTAYEIDIGGIVGDYEAYKTRGRNTVIKNCYVDATLSAKHTGVSKVECVGGLVGHSENISFIDGCTVKGTYTATATGSNLGIAGIIGSMVTAGITNPLVVITNSVIEADVENDVYGYLKSGVRMYVRGCSATQDTATVDITESTTAADLTRKVGLIDSAADIKMIGTTLPLDGFYRLKSNVSMNDEKLTGSVIDGTFSGVFDGNGFAITDLVMAPEGDSTKQIGFFSSLSYTDSTGDSVVTDLAFGTKEKPVSVAGGDGQYFGVLAGYAGSGNNYQTSNRAVVNGVDVYLDMNYTGSSVQLLNGGLVGATYMTAFLDCNVYGSVTSPSNATFAHRNQIGGFVGATSNVNDIIFYNCNNFADMDIKCTSANYRVHLGGFIGNAAGTELFLNCNNFGSIAADCVVNASNDIAVGGFVGCDYRYTTFVDCANFGNLSAAGTTEGAILAGGLVGYANANEGVMTLAGFGQYGNVDGGECANTIYKSEGSEVDYAITMKSGASVRIASDTGLRFEATVSKSATDRLKAIFGEKVQITRGILIAPELFVERAGGYTHEALEAYSVPVNGFAEGQKAYIEVMSDEWFKGNEGDIAGSITGLSSANYDTKFVGAGFLAISVGGVEIAKLYADNAQSRDICYVAKRALGDLSTTEGAEKNGYIFDKALATGETYYDADGKAQTVAEGEALYSCYSKAQRDILNGIVSGSKMTVATFDENYVAASFGVISDIHLTGSAESEQDFQVALSQLKKKRDITAAGLTL